MKALVTGGAGFIGSTLVDRLLDEGHEVSVIDDFSGGKASNLEDARTRHGDKLSVRELDIRSEETAAVVEALAPEVVFHLAAQMDVRVSVADPVFDAAVNITGGINVLEGARLGGARKVLFASSGGTIYGRADESLMPFDETTAQKPISPYGITKKAYGDYLFAYNELYGLDYAVLALANIYGPRQNPHGEAGVVAIFAQRMLKGERCKIFGDGEATRDYVYVDDVVDAFVRAASAGTGLFNIGTAKEMSTNELYANLAKVAGFDEDPEYLPARSGELDRACISNELARTELGWSPQTDFATGCQNVLDFIKARS